MCEIQWIQIKDSSLLFFPKQYTLHCDSKVTKMGPRAGQKFIWILRTSKTVCRPALEGKLFSSSHPGLSPSNTCSNRTQVRNKIYQGEICYDISFSHVTTMQQITYIKLKITSQIQPFILKVVEEMKEEAQRKQRSH